MIHEHNSISSYLSFQGYLVIEDFFREDELQPVRDCINRVVDDLALKLYKAGKIKSMFIRVVVIHTI